MGELNKHYSLEEVLSGHLLPRSESKPEDNPDFYAWAEIGIKNGWISPIYCGTHDGGYDYFTDEERSDYDDGGDPCEFVFRVLG